VALEIDARGANMDLRRLNEMPERPFEMIGLIATAAFLVIILLWVGDALL
jgi:hypothetical protein